MLELFLQGSSPVPRAEGIHRIRPVVVDSSFLVADLLHATRRGRETDFLRALEHGSFRAFAPHHVWAEMGRKCRDVPLAHGLDPQRASDIWWAEYVPRLYVVETTGLEVPLAEMILQRDGSDAGTFALAGLLAPVVVLSTDRDIIDPGVATQSYRVLVENAGVITVVSQGAWSGLVAASLAVEGVKGVGRCVARVAAHPAGPPLFFALLLVAILTRRYWLPKVRDGAPRAWQGVRSLAAPQIEQLAGQYRAANRAWDEEAFMGGSPSRHRSAARILAAASAPMSRGALTDALEPAATERDRRLLMRELAVLLAEIPAFSPVGGSHWRLGRRGVDFGGVVESAERLLSPCVPRLSLGQGPRPT